MHSPRPARGSTTSRTRRRQYIALSKAYASAGGVAREIHPASAGGWHRALHPGRRRQLRVAAGAYDSYTQGMDPLIVMGAPDENLQVRAYIDEILIDRLADPSKLSRRDVHPRHRQARAFDIRARTAVRVAEDRALRRTAGAGRRARAARDFPLREPEEPARVSRAAGRCLCQRPNKPRRRSRRTAVVQCRRARPVAGDSCGTRSRWPGARWVPIFTVPAPPARHHYANGGDPAIHGSAHGTAQTIRSATPPCRRRLVATVSAPRSSMR